MGNHSVCSVLNSRRWTAAPVSTAASASGSYLVGDGGVPREGSAAPPIRGALFDRWTAASGLVGRRLHRGQHEPLRPVAEPAHSMSPVLNGDAPADPGQLTPGSCSATG